MSTTGLPSAEEALGSLRKCGDQFATAPRRAQPLGVTFYHPRKGDIPISADDAVVSATGKLYVNDPRLAAALRERGGRVESYEDARRMIQRHLHRGQLVWGVSGYASTGFSCERGAANLQELYTFFKASKPSFVVDGAAGAGALGLNGVLASMHGVTTVGISPLQGLSSMAPRNHTIVYGNAYQDREFVISTIPDALACVGGGEGTLRECRRALLSGVAVLFFEDEGALKAAIDQKADSLLLDAIKRRQLVVCKPQDDVHNCALHVTEYAREALRTSRKRRFESVARALS